MSPSPVLSKTVDFSKHGMEHVGLSDYAGWVRTAIIVTMIGYSLTVVGLIVSAERTPVTESLIVVAAIASLALVKRGKVRQGAMLVILSTWVELLIGPFELGGLKGYDGIVVFPTVVVVVGLLTGRRGAFAITLVTAAGAPLAALLGRLTRGELAAMDWATEGYFAFILAVTLVVTAVFVDRGLATFGWHVERSRRDERRFADLFMNAPDGMVLLGPEGRIESVNPFAEGLFATAGDELKGLSWSELPLRWKEREGAPAEDLLRTSEESPQPIEIARRDGTRVAAEVASRRVLHEGGRSGSVLIVRDVSERLAMEQRVAQLGSILREATTEIYVIGAQPLEFLSVSRGACDNLGYSPGELGKLPVAAVIADLSSGQHHHLSENGRSRNEVAVRRTVHRRKDGSAYPAEHQIQTGELAGRSILIIFAVDVTDRERAEAESNRLRERLQQAQKLDAVGLLAGGVAHDFNNLLTVIGGSAELIEMTTEGEPHQLASDIMKAHDQGALLTRRLLAFARQEVVQPIVLAMPDSIEEARPLLDTLLGERIELTMTCTGSGSIIADPGQLEQVLLNLAANARDAMPVGGRVNISTDVDVSRPGFLRVAVQDEGTGMEPEIVERAVEPFYTTKARAKGTGLGLSTVHGIVTQNGGAIEFDTVPGGGTTVSVFWPLSDTEARDHRSSSREAYEATTRSTILVAEDNDATRRIVCLHLEHAGYEVIAAEDGEQALALLQDGLRPALLLSDVVMPGMSGIELAETVTRTWPDLRVLLMSGYMEGHLNPDREVAPRELIQKPFRGPELIERVRTVISAVTVP